MKNYCKELWQEEKESVHFKLSFSVCWFVDFYFALTK